MLLFVQYGCTALMEAADNGHVEIVELLLKAGADINLKNHVNLFSEFVCLLSFSINLFVCNVICFTFVNVFIVRKERLL